MSDGRDIVVQALAETASHYGFRGVRATNFYREWPETICLLNLQKSSWGPQFYVNAAVWFTRLGPERRPKEHKCHIRWRVDSTMEDEQSKMFTQALNLEHPLPGDLRLSLIKDGVAAYGFRLLSHCESEQAALRVADEREPHVMVALKARSQEKAN
ncbi:MULTISPECIES: DUF4304 domain-containing protein [Mesorhizobium]|uniref:DUF4304 domain-containing protein n=5 Tax=Mesorhizobium TaxID=68287 RepID=A0A1A5I678_RHILI|nr:MULTISPECIES: DUF4304 domain-containing protein [Mesorhizobium]MBE1707520.1 DUF4304 domain-containing protein [Mesorhizobium japonicum]MBE1712644.1 DUF4304 domain-containing protein [Mesorhizobium japonicum]MUT24545.1 DUF4304 domain-containing protein [Mesorhizobium japonicum]MUT29473.1 DUF4304 domain-containing protein [Mesorhizobium japonicum]OBP73388.1 hypothetical protein BAE42_14805 [Mesorhizobium loti]